MIHKKWLEDGSPDTWATLDLRVLLLNEASTYSPLASDVYVADLTPGTNELSNAGYSRETLTGLAATWNGTDNVWELEADDVDFGALTPSPGTQGVKGWAVYVHVTNDADSWVVRSYTGSASTLNTDHVRIAWVDGIVLTRGEA